MATNIIKRDTNIRRSVFDRISNIKPMVMDVPIIAAIIGLMILSLLSIYSATNGNVFLMSKQAIFFCLGFFIMFLLARYEIYYFRNLAYILYAIGILLLVVTLLFGVEINGSKRWIDLGVINFQPSEYMKIVLPLTICAVLTYKPLPISWEQLLIVLGLVLLPVSLVFLQPDLGTAMIIAIASGCLIFLAGIRFRAAITMILTILGSLPLAWFYLLHDYHKSRILSFIDPSADPLDSGWTLIQSKIAVGTGGMTGKGWGNSQQASHEFLPETHTDFIFSIIAEEFGFIGVLLLLSVYFFIIVRGLIITTQARNAFEKLFCGGLIFIFCSYILINIGMVTGMLPIVGVPLPLISYGGTSLVTTMGAFGILMSVAAHSRKVI